MRSFKYGVVAAIVAIAGFAGSASAGASNTSITIEVDGNDFSGKVMSSAAGCKANRKVVLLKKRSGKDQKIATDTTENNGEWNTGNTGQNKGRFYAKVKPAGDCDFAKSETVKL